MATGENLVGPDTGSTQTKTNLEYSEGRGQCNQFDNPSPDGKCSEYYETPL